MMTGFTRDNTSSQKLRPSGIEPETCGFENEDQDGQANDPEDLFKYPFI
jgi:hypothetical protein